MPQPLELAQTAQSNEDTPPQARNPTPAKVPYRVVRICSRVCSGSKPNWASQSLG